MNRDFQFGALTPLEPRLGKKLIEPLTSLIHRQVDNYYDKYFSVAFINLPDILCGYINNLDVSVNEFINFILLTSTVHQL